VRESSAASSTRVGERRLPLKPQRRGSGSSAGPLGPDDILVSDVGAHKLWIARMYPCAAPNTCLSRTASRAWGSRSPERSAPKLLPPEKRVLAAVRRWWFPDDVQELETAVRARRRFVTVVFEDGAYGSSSGTSCDATDGRAFVDFGNPASLRLAGAFGCRGYRVTAAAELGPSCRMPSGRMFPAVVACPVDYGETCD